MQPKKIQAMPSIDFCIRINQATRKGRNLTHRVLRTVKVRWEVSPEDANRGRVLPRRPWLIWSKRAEGLLKGANVREFRTRWGFLHRRLSPPPLMISCHVNDAWSELGPQMKWAAMSDHFHWQSAAKMHQPTGMSRINCRCLWTVHTFLIHDNPTVLVLFFNTA